MSRKDGIEMETIVIKIASGDYAVADMASLRRLMISAGFECDFAKTNTDTAMGIDIMCLAVFIPVMTEAIKSLAAVLTEWVRNREISYTIEDTNNGRRIVYSSKSGKDISQDEIARLLTNKQGGGISQ